MTVGTHAAPLVIAVLLAALPPSAPPQGTGAGPDAGPGATAGPIVHSSNAPITAPAGFALPVPAPAVVLTPFRPPENRYGRGHRGVDLAAGVGAPVRAAGPGVVVFAGMLAGRGVVSIQHAGGLRTTYEPVTASVSAGQPVALGDPIGTLSAGHAPCAPADCLHWGARLPDGSYLDPMSLLRPWRVRLKPWDAPAGDGANRR